MDPRQGLQAAHRRAALNATPLLVWAVVTCAAPPELAADPARQKYAPQDVQVVDTAGLEQLRKSGTYSIDGPLGTATGAAPCPSENDTRECIEAAWQRLREAAAARGANLVAVVKSVMAQSFPPRYSATGDLYEATPRR